MTRCRSVSEGFGREDDRVAEPETAEIGADRVVVADDDRRETRGVEVARHRGRHLVGRQPFDPRNELGEIGVGQIVQRQLRRGAGDLVGRLEVARVAARQRRRRQPQLLGGDRAGYRPSPKSRRSIPRSTAPSRSSARRPAARTDPGRRRNSNAVRAP